MLGELLGVPDAVGLPVDVDAGLLPGADPHHGLLLVVLLEGGLDTLSQVVLGGLAWGNSLLDLAQETHAAEKCATGIMMLLLLQSYFAFWYIINSSLWSINV